MSEEFSPEPDDGSFASALDGINEVFDSWKAPYELVVGLFHVFKLGLAYPLKFELERGKLPTLDAGIFHVDVPDARFVVKKDDFVVDVDVMSAVPMAVDGITALLFRGTKRNAEGAYEPAFVCVAGDVVVMATEREVLEKYDAVDPVDPKSLKSSYDLSKFANERTSLAIFAFVQAVVAGSAFEPEASV